MRKYAAQHILFLRMVALFGHINRRANGFSQATFLSNYKMKLRGVLAVVTRTACLRCMISVYLKI